MTTVFFSEKSECPRFAWAFQNKNVEFEGTGFKRAAANTAGHILIALAKSLAM